MSQPNTQIMVFLLGLFVTGVRWNSESCISSWLQKHISVCPNRFVPWCKSN